MTVREKMLAGQRKILWKKIYVMGKGVQDLL